MAAYVYQWFKEEVRILVVMLKPTSLGAPFGLAKLQEKEILKETLSHMHKEMIEVEGQEIDEVHKEKPTQVQPQGTILV